MALCVGGGARPVAGAARPRGKLPAVGVRPGGFRFGRGDRNGGDMREAEPVGERSGGW